MKSNKYFKLFKHIKLTLLLFLYMGICVNSSKSSKKSENKVFLNNKKNASTFIENHRPNGMFEFSKMKFFPNTNQKSPRQTYNFNIGWRFYRGDIASASKKAFNDKKWKLVNAPHPVDYLPENASGSVNYQGVAWYRKKFTLPKSARANKNIFLNFEGLMGKSEIYLNGVLLRKYYGGFLPIIVDLTSNLVSRNNIIAVKVDNSDDPSYPPGKPQKYLDFAYLGGLYRDVSLITTHKKHITDPNFIDKVAGGGVFVHYGKVNANKAEVFVKTHITNSGQLDHNKHRIKASLFNQKGEKVAEKASTFTFNNKKEKNIKQKFTLTKPLLWHPDSPNLHDLWVRVYNQKDKLVDEVRLKIGIRSINITLDGLFINEEYFPEKLFGANRHQDYGTIGNALPNSLHYKDVKKLRDTGLRIIRSAHYPQDPAFMDAADSLGMFVIVATPGWQFWNNKDKKFAKRYYYNTRAMIRRDRNRPSVFMWEPTLNETRVPYEIEKKIFALVKEEYPYPHRFAVGDHSKAVQEFADVRYKLNKNEAQKKPLFVREWGDNVDGWGSQNSTSRVSRSWGEWAQLIGAFHYVKPAHKEGPIGPYNYWGSLFKYAKRDKSFIGGTLWHPFDHQRGYHPAPFFGGIMDVYREPKISYYAFKANRNPYVKLSSFLDSGPFLHIANYLTPFSPRDIVVFANVEEVRLSVFEGPEKSIKKSKIDVNPFVFKDAFKFMESKKLTRSKIFDKLYVKADGLINNKIVVSEKRFVARKAHQIQLVLDDEKMPILANGTDIVKVTAYVVDDKGIKRRLSENMIYFHVEGEGEIVALNENVGVNPKPLKWGSAPILIRTTLKAGKITVRAFPNVPGIASPKNTVLSFSSITPKGEQFVYSEKPILKKTSLKNIPQKGNFNYQELKKVEADQSFFETGK